MNLAELEADTAELERITARIIVAAVGLDYDVDRLRPVFNPVLGLQQVGRGDCLHIDFETMERRTFAHPGPIVFADVPALVREQDQARLAEIVRSLPPGSMLVMGDTLPPDGMDWPALSVYDAHRALTPQSAPSYFEHVAKAATHTGRWSGLHGNFNGKRYRK